MEVIRLTRASEFFLLHIRVVAVSSRERRPIYLKFSVVVGDSSWKSWKRSYTEKNSILIFTITLVKINIFYIKLGL